VLTSLRSSNATIHKKTRSLAIRRKVTSYEGFENKTFFKVKSVSDRFFCKTYYFWSFPYHNGFSYFKNNLLISYLISRYVIRPAELLAHCSTYVLYVLFWNYDTLNNYTYNSIRLNVKLFITLWMILYIIHKWIRKDHNIIMLKGEYYYRLFFLYNYFRSKKYGAYYKFRSIACGKS